MVVVDTSVWVDYFRGEANEATQWLQEALRREPLALTDLILCELLQGAPNERAALAIETRVKALVLWESGGGETARLAAANYRRMRQAGFTVRSTIDCLVATVCLHRGLALLHRDRDFDGFEQVLGLAVLHP